MRGAGRSVRAGPGARPPTPVSSNQPPSQAQPGVRPLPTPLPPPSPFLLHRMPLMPLIRAQRCSIRCAPVHIPFPLPEPQPCSPWSPPPSPPPGISCKSSRPSSRSVRRPRPVSNGGGEGGGGPASPPGRRPTNASRLPELRSSAPALPLLLSPPPPLARAALRPPHTRGGVHGYGVVLFPSGPAWPSPFPWPGFPCP